MRVTRVKKTFLIGALLVFIAQALTAQSIIQTEGIGNTEEEARTSALQQMSQRFGTQVQTSTDALRQYNETSAKKTKTTSISTLEMRTHVTSDMLLYGVKFKTSKSSGEYIVTATMDPKVSIPLYKSEIEATVKKINARYKGINKLSGDKEDAEWQALATDYATLVKQEMVLRALGVQNQTKPELSSEDFNIKYEQRAKEITSLEGAAKKIASAVQGAAKNIYVYPAQYEGENTATDFSTALANAVKSELGKKLALVKLGSDSYLKGSYYFAPGSVDGEDIIVTYYLCATDGSVLASSGMIKIPYRVYSAYKYVPKSYDLQAEVAAGRVSNPDFDISIRVNGDRTGLEFRRGDSLVIEARASSSCYIYVLGYVYNDEGNVFTYLFPLEPYASGKEMFVKKISAKDANRWVVLNPVVEGEVANIEVIPPYGEEMLHIFASTTDDYDEFVSRIPAYIETDDFYLVSGEPVKNISKTRALNVKRVANKASKVVNNAESTVSYATHK